MTDTMPKIMNDLPQTIGGMLDKRRVVENRLDNSSTLTNGYKDFKFWGNTKESVKDALSQLQSMLDRYAVLTELNETHKAVSVLKYTNVTVPQFVPSMSSVRLTIAQLRDTQKWLTPLTVELEQHLTKQATEISRLISVYDNAVRVALDAEKAELQNDYNKKVTKARTLKEAIPTDEHLQAELETAQRRADDKTAVRVDSVSVKNVISKLRTFNNYINTEINTVIDSCNSSNVSAEIAEFNKLRSCSYNRFSSGGCTSVPNKSPDTDTMSLADLSLRCDELYQNISNAISKLQVVTFKKGKNARHEHNVEDASRNLAEVCKNMLTLMAYRHAHHYAMSLEFTTIHPLTKHPLSVDGLVRLGYMPDAKKNKSEENSSDRLYQSEDNSNGRLFTYSRRATHSTKTPTSLRMGLQDIMTKLANVEREVSSDKNRHELNIKESISTKQEARSKSGTTVKAGELDDIAKSVSSANTKEWYVSDHLNEALEKVRDLIVTVDSLQSSQRKSANANIMVSVPKVFPMSWADVNDGLDGW
jgi:hypothetical protein